MPHHRVRRSRWLSPRAFGLTRKWVSDGRRRRVGEGDAVVVQREQSQWFGLSGWSNLRAEREGVVVGWAELRLQEGPGGPGGRQLLIARVEVAP